MAAGIFDIVTLDTDENGVQTERRVHLNNEFGAFHIKTWNPLMPAPQDLFQESPFSDGRVLAMRKYGNAADELILDVQDCDPNNEIRTLRAILKKAVEYWTLEWTTEPVWIEIQGDEDTEILYSYIYAWHTPGETNPFQPPRSKENLIEEFNLQIEHSFWLEALSGSCVGLKNLTDNLLQQSGNYQPQASGDDAWANITAATLTLTGDSFTCGKSAVPNTYGNGIRFKTLNIPQGAYIQRAYMIFEADVNGANDSCKVNIYGDDVDNSAIFSTFANFTGRARTTAVTPWTIPHITAGTKYQTPDITAVLQEVVSRPGWASGNSFSVLLDDNGSTNGAIRQFVQWDHAGAPAEPYLYVFWFDSTTLTFGQTITCQDEVYFSARHNYAQLTNVFYLDASTGVYSLNLLNAATPYNLLPAAVQVGDLLYFCIDSLSPNAGPFGNIIFDLSVSDVGLNGTWSYWNGAWTATPLTQSDNTIRLTVAGVTDYCFVQNADWTTTTVNGITGLYIRFEVTAVGTGVSPKQQNRQIFTSHWPYVDIDSSQVGGDVSMLANLKIYTKQRVQPSFGKIYAGLRTLRRGPDFTAYLNFSQVQKLSAVTISAGLNASFVADTQSPTGQAILWNSAGTIWDVVSILELGAPLAQNFVGSFYMFLQLRLTAAASNYQFRVSVGAGSEMFSRTIGVTPVTTASPYITYCTLGEIKIAPDPKQKANKIDFQVEAITGNIANNAYLYSLILLPNDEWIGAYGPNSVTGLFLNADYLDVDPISMIKLSDVAIERDVLLDQQQAIFQDNGPKLPQLWEKNIQRLWFFQPGQTGSNAFAYPWLTCSLKINGLKRYWMGWK